MAYTFLQPAACFVYDERQASSEATDGSAASQRRLLVAGAAAAVQGEDTAAGGSNRGSSRGLLKAGSKKGGKGGGKKQQKAPAPPKAAEVVAPLPGSYSAAVLAALRSESSIAAHQAVKQLKAEVMNHNQMVAAAFMAGTEGQFSAAERAADAAAWRLRVLERGPSLDAAPGGPAR